MNFEKKYRIWDAYNGSFVWDASINNPMLFDTHELAETYIDEKLWDFYADKPISVFKVL